MITVNGVINAGEWGQPWYVGQGSDPLITVSDADTTEPVPNPDALHSPIASAIPAPPADGGDHHMAFFDLTQPTFMWSYFACSFNNGTDVTGGVTCGLGSVSDACGDGVTNTVSACALIIIFAIGTLPFVIGNCRLALFNTMLPLFQNSPDLAKSPGPTWTDNIPWPNTHEDYFGPQQYTGNLIAGSTIGIPASVDLNSLGLSQGGMMIAKALQQYGAIWRDTPAAPISLLFMPNLRMRTIRCSIRHVAIWARLCRNCVC